MSPYLYPKSNMLGLLLTIWTALLNKDEKEILPSPRLARGRSFF
jgi:hypothetical protein